MKKLLAFTILSLAILSCKKDKITPQTPLPNPHYSYTHVTTAGSYWVYDWYEVDSLGNQAYLPALKDTIRIMGDTTINGKIYQIHKGKSMGMDTESYSRDSSGYIIDMNGDIIYSYTSAPRLLKSYPDFSLNVKTFIGEKQTISTDFGTKEASTTYMEVTMHNGDPVNVCGDLSARFYSYYVSGIGNVGSEVGTFSEFQSQCSKKRSRLSAYYIAP